MQTDRVYKIIYKDSIDSTSAALRKMLPDVENLTVLSARMQTSGRGQLTHEWHSAPGENLTFSIFLEYDHLRCFQAKRQQLLSMASALSVVDFLASYGIGAQIKKPNDIYVGDRKICGMLIENSLSGENMNWSIVGIGINVNQTEFPSFLPNPVSMLQLMPGERPLNLDECLEKFLECFDRQLDRIWDESSELEDEFNSKITALRL